MVNVNELILAGGGIVTTLLWILSALVIIGGILFILFAILPYKHNVRVRILTGDKTLIVDDKAKEVKTRGGVLKWKLRKMRDFVPVPPKDAIHLTKRGKYAVEAYYTPEKEYKYIIDKGIAGDTSGFNPLSTKDREFYANEMREAELYRKKAIWEYIEKLAPYAVMLVMFIMFLVFYQDIAAPSIEMQNAARQTVERVNQITDKQLEITKQLTAASQGRQIVPVIPIPQNETT